MTLSISDTQENNALTLCLLSLCRRYSECHFAECLGATTSTGTNGAGKTDQTDYNKVGHAMVAMEVLVATVVMVATVATVGTVVMVATVAAVAMW